VKPTPTLPARLAALLALLLSSAAAPASASDFAGWRVGVDLAHGWTRAEADASRVRDAATGRLAEGERRGAEDIARGAAALGRLEAERAAFLGAFPPGLAPAATPLDPAIAALSGKLAAGSANLDRTRADLAAFRAHPARPTAEASGLGVRLHAGRMFALGQRLHLGGELEFGPQPGRARRAPVPGVSATAESGWVVGASARLGWLVHPRVLPFALAGVEATEWRFRSGQGTGAEVWPVWGRVGVGSEILVAPRTVARVSWERAFGAEARFAGANVTAERDTLRLGVARLF